MATNNIDKVLSGEGYTLSQLTQLFVIFFNKEDEKYYAMKKDEWAEFSFEHGIGGIIDIQRKKIH